VALAPEVDAEVEPVVIPGIAVEELDPFALAAAFRASSRAFCADAASQIPSATRNATATPSRSTATFASGPPESSGRAGRTGSP
jgi:hypothetical protein